MLPILYCHSDSGYSYKVALALALLGIDFEQRHIAIWKPREERSQAFRSVAAHGEVPVNVAKEDAERLALAEPGVAQFVAGQTVKKVIVVPGKIVNIVVG